MLKDALPSGRWPAAAPAPPSRLRVPAEDHGVARTELSGEWRGAPAAPSGQWPAAAPAPPAGPHTFTEDPSGARLGPVHPSAITGTGPTSRLVAAGPVAPTPPTAAFLVEGFHPATSDGQVWDLVSPMVCNLHQCQEVQCGGEQEGTKTYRIVVDAADCAAVLNPTHWPAGLRVCALSGQRAQQF